MTHEQLQVPNESELFFTSLTLRFKTFAMRHRLGWNSLNLIAGAGQESILFKPGHRVIYTREILKYKKFLSTDLFVIQTLAPGEWAQTLLGVQPGAKVLLHVQGFKKIKKNLEFFDQLQLAALNLKTLPHWLWTEIHARNEAQQPLDLLLFRVLHETWLLNS